MNVFGYYFRPRELVCCRVLADGRLKEFASARSDDWGLLAVDPHGRWLCVAPEFQPQYVSQDFPEKPWRKTTRLRFYALDERGLPGMRTDLTVRVTAFQILACPTGRRLFINGGDSLTSVGVSATGNPRLDCVKKFDSGYPFIDQSGDRYVTDLTVSPDGRYLFPFFCLGFLDHASYNSWLFSVDSRGTLTQVGPVHSADISGGSRDIGGWNRLMRDGKTMVVHEWSKVRSFLWDRGNYKNPKLLAPDCTNVVFDPKDRFVYISGASARGLSVSIFRRTAPGNLALVARQAGIEDIFAIDPLGRFAYERRFVKGKPEGRFQVWRIAESGRLDLVGSAKLRDTVRFAAR